MNILHLEYAGKTGGIEKLCKDIGNASRIDHQYFLFVHEGGSIYDEMKKDHLKVECLNLNNYQIYKLYNMILRYKLYHAKFFREYGLRYPVGKIHEDMFLTPQILYYTKKMVITNEQLYFYRQRENSIMNSSFSIKQLDALDAIEFRIELFQHWNKQYLQASEYESYIRKSNELYKKMKEEETDLYIEAQERIKTKMKDFRNKKSIFNMLSWKYRIKLMAFLIMER